MIPAFASLDEIAAAAERAGTPCYVYGPGLAAQRMSHLRQLMGHDRIQVAYAVKANPRPEFLSEIARTGCDFDVASNGELERALAAGVTGERMVFSGPGKSEAEIARAVSLKVRVNAEGERDLRLAAKYSTGTPVAVNLRINPAGGAGGAGNIIGGAGPSRFGVDEGRLDEVLDRWGTHDQVEIRGVQVFTASNLLDPKELERHHRAAFLLARRVQEQLRRRLDTIDLGGGLGIPYADTERELNLLAVHDALRRLLDEHPWFTGRILLEPGRWISGPCGAYVARVLEIKDSQGTRFAVIDGGIHHLVRPALIKTDQPCAVVRPGVGPLPAGGTPVTFGGPLCTGIDILARGVPCGDPQEGDLVVFMQTGAYGETEAMPDFLLHPYPKIAFL